MKMQLANLTAYLIAVGLLATGLSAPLLENSVTKNALSYNNLASESSIKHGHERSNEEGLPFLERAGPLVARAFDGTNHALAPSGVEVERRIDSTKKPPEKTLIEKKPPTKAPAGGKPPKTIPVGKEPALKLEFTKYPTKKQKWTPPKVKKPAAKPAAKLQPKSLAAIQKTKVLSLEKRADIDVDEGKTGTGRPADRLRTWHVINCIAIAGYDTRTRAKAMAHINAVSTAGTEYSEQFGRFANIVYNWAGPVEIWVRWPHKTAIPSGRQDLVPKQKVFEDDIKSWVEHMRAEGFKVFNQPATKREGDMIMESEGDVAVDT